MKKLLIILFFSPLLANAQQHAASHDTIFLDVNWNITKYRPLAKYYREMSELDEDSMILVHDYYLENHAVQMVGTYIKEMKPSNQHGRFKYFYPNGNIKAIYDYQYGIIHGELERYYNNGQLKSVEQFDMGTKIDTTWTYFNNGQLHKILVINKNFSDANPSDKFTRNKLVAAWTRDGEQLIEKGSGEYKEFFLSGKLKSTTEYENGFPHGKWIKYSGHKKKKSCVMTFKHGQFIKGEMYDNGKKDIFSSLHRKAYFPTGIIGLEEFIDYHVGQCEDGFSNEVIILVNISTTGQVSLDQIISGNINACQEEEINVLIKNMPQWKPAVYDGKYVEGSTSIKLNFSN